MREAAKKMNTTNENLYARNFYNRMRAAAAAEHKISDGLKGLAKETAGLKPEEIAAAERRRISRGRGASGRPDEHEGRGQHRQRHGGIS